MKQGFALVDCNNFYASCEKLFRPDLLHSPVVVLSNNDGCVVARSAEAKALGIKMGTPWFKLRHEAGRYGIRAFSSNYALYADLSSRVMCLLESLAPAVEVYSIDEAFLDISGIDATVPLFDFGHHVKTAIGNWVGIPVGVGMAPTKTLAKLANYAAKHYPATGGVVNLARRDRQRKLMALTPVKEVWGVGRRLAGHLDVKGMRTALDLADASPRVIRQQFSIMLERTMAELNGEACEAVDTAGPPLRKQLVCSRSFGQRITRMDDMKQAVSNHVARAAEKLRHEGLLAGVLTVFMRTGFFNPTEPQYTNTATGRLAVPSDDTRDLAKLAMQLLEGIWKDGYRYAKAGVMLADIVESKNAQPDFFAAASRPQSHELMAVMDDINHSGIGQVFMAGQGVPDQRKCWTMQRHWLSPAYTTRWSDLPQVS